MRNEAGSMQPHDMPCDAHEVDTRYPTPLKAVRAHCLWCCNGSYTEAKLCPAKACSLWPFRPRRRPSAEDNVRSVRPAAPPARARPDG